MIYADISRRRPMLVGEHVAADTIACLEMKFNFRTGDWDGLAKWVHFANGETVYDIPLTGDRIRKEDHLNLTTGEWKVYLRGNGFACGTVTERITTSVEVLCGKSATADKAGDMVVLHYVPGVGTESLFEHIDEQHDGSRYDPIPYDGNTARTAGLYCRQYGAVYRGIRDTATAVYNALSELTGIYTGVYE